MQLCGRLSGTGARREASTAASTPRNTLLAPPTHPDILGPGGGGGLVSTLHVNGQWPELSLHAVVGASTVTAITPAFQRAIARPHPTTTRKIPLVAQFPRCAAAPRAPPGRRRYAKQRLGTPRSPLTHSFAQTGGDALRTHLCMRAAQHFVRQDAVLCSAVAVDAAIFVSRRLGRGNRLLGIQNPDVVG